jgi:hypothetical protein
MSEPLSSLDPDPEQLEPDRPDPSGPLANIGTKMRNVFVGAVSLAYTVVSFRPRAALAVTASVASWVGQRLRWRERVQTLTDLVVFRFEPERVELEGDEHVEDFFGSHRGGSKLLGHYSIPDCANIIENSPIGEAFRQRGVDDWYIEFDLTDPFLHYAYVMRRSLPDREKALASLIVQSTPFRYDRSTPPLTRGARVIHAKFPPDLDLLHIRWLSLQDPTVEFSPDRPRLPGQRYPGSRIGRRVFGLVFNLARAHARDGLINIPEHFHNAYLYEDFKFLNPDDEGVFQRIARDLRADIRERGLAMVSWAIHLGYLNCGGEKWSWKMREQVLPLSRAMNAYFHSSDYVSAAEAQKSECPPFSINWDEAETMALNAILAC